MIVSLKFSNFKSYRDPAEFSFEALDSVFNSESVKTVIMNDGTKIRLLTASVIFGANASGKSNVIMALASLADTVKESLQFTSDHHPYFILPYAFDKAYLAKPTKIELDFIYDGDRYRYSVTGKNDIICKESLKKIINGNEICVFDRNSKCTVKTGKGWPADKNLASDSNILPNQLMLSWLATKASAGLQNVASYIANLNIYWGSFHSGASRRDRQEVMETIVKNTDSQVFKRLKRLMHVADLGISTITAHRRDDNYFNILDSADISEKERFIKENRWNVRLGHSTANPKEVCLLDFNQESDGTKAVFGVGARLLAALETGAFVAYDEINDAIHPALLRFLVSFFQSPVSNPHGAQLLFSTQDASVADHNTLRADQVWFVEKKDAVSDLFSAQDFEDVSIQVPFESWYRTGRFGALPSIGNIKSIFEN